MHKRLIPKRILDIMSKSQAIQQREAEKEEKIHLSRRTGDRKNSVRRTLFPDSGSSKRYLFDNSDTNNVPEETEIDVAEETEIDVAEETEIDVAEETEIDVSEETEIDVAEETEIDVENDEESLLTLPVEGSIYETELVTQDNATTSLETCARCLPLSAILRKNKTNRFQERKRKWDRKNYCLFCVSLVTNFSRHILKHHHKETEVQEYMMIQDADLKNRKKKRQEITDKLRKKGNFLYNSRIINERANEELIPMKRPAKNNYKVTAVTHVVCKYCYGLFKKENLYQHLHKCLQNTQFRSDTTEEASSSRNRALKSGSFMLAPEIPEATESLKKLVYPTMIKDNITLVAKSDPLIVQFGSRFYKNHRDSYQTNYVSLKMRDLARVLIKMKEVNTDINYLEDCLSPKQFDNLMDVIRILSGFNEETGDCKIPSLAPRLCSSLKICADIIRSSVIKDAEVMSPEKNSISKQVDEFLHLMKTEWRVEVSTNAEKTRKKRKVGTIDVLPDSEDIARVCNGICRSYKHNTEKLKNNPSLRNYETLAKYLIAHIIILSRRRPGEVVRSTLKNYYSTHHNDDMLLALKESMLSEEEKKSGEELHIYYVSGKNTRKVPCLLTQEMKQALDCLIENRNNVGISDNPLLFARPDTSLLYDGSKIIDEIKSKFSLNNDKHFTATGLRHHAATYSQLHGRNDTYAENLATFMGHDLTIHKSNYRLPLEIIQKAEVGHKLLEMTVSKKHQDQTLSPASTTTSNSDTCHRGNSSPEKNRNKTKSKNVEASTSADRDYVYESEDSDIQSPPPKKIQRIRWNDNEKEIIYKYFGRHFVSGEHPERREIKKMYEAETGLNRTLEQVCTYINNIVKGKVILPSCVIQKIKQGKFVKQ